MDNRVARATGTALILWALAGCAGSPWPIASPPGTLTAGTAEVTIGGQFLGATHAVACTALGPLTVIATGDNNAGTTVMLDNIKKLKVNTVRISGLKGFTGSYQSDLQGTGDVHMKRQTYEITGLAVGVLANNPSAQATSAYDVRVAC
jgi:lipoprotein LpqH